MGREGHGRGGEGWPPFQIHEYATGLKYAPGHNSQSSNSQHLQIVTVHVDDTAEQ